MTKCQSADALLGMLAGIFGIECHIECVSKTVSGIAKLNLGKLGVLEDPLGIQFVTLLNTETALLTEIGHVLSPVIDIPLADFVNFLL